MDAKSGERSGVEGDDRGRERSRGLSVSPVEHAHVVTWCVVGPEDLGANSRQPQMLTDAVPASSRLYSSITSGPFPIFETPVAHHRQVRTNNTYYVGGSALMTRVFQWSASTARFPKGQYVAFQMSSSPRSFVSGHTLRHSIRRLDN